MSNDIEVMQALKLYSYKSMAEKVWASYEKDCARYGLEDQAENILEQTCDHMRLDVLLDELILDAELKNGARVNVSCEKPDDVYEPPKVLATSNFFANEREYSEEMILPSSASKPLVLYDSAKITKPNTRFWNKKSRQYKAKK
jgi:hypothetical protein